jgi:hypothetical protein
LERADVVDKPVAHLRYGSRKAAKLVRCYWKNEINAYRVELELHPGVLDKHDVVTVQDLPKAARAIYPKHIRFAEINWEKLREYLTRRNGENAEAIFEGAFKRRRSMRRFTEYLRRQGIPNVHRFLVQLTFNEKVKRALETWAIQFEKEYEEEHHSVLGTKKSQ